MYLGFFISNESWGRQEKKKKVSSSSSASSRRRRVTTKTSSSSSNLQSHVLSTIIIIMKACNFMCPSAPPRFTTTPYPVHLRTYNTSRAAAPLLQVKSFQRGDFDRFAENVKSGKAWRDAWRTANDGFEQFVFEAKKTAERIDREYAVSRRLSSAASSAGDRAREIDREYGISPRVRTLSADFSRNFPKVRFVLSFLSNTKLQLCSAIEKVIMFSCNVRQKLILLNVFYLNSTGSSSVISWIHLSVEVLL